MRRTFFSGEATQGDEIDVVMEEQQRLIPVKIKAGQTVSQDFFKGLSKWQKIAGDETSKGVVIYAGDHSYERQEGRVVSWKDIRLPKKWEVKLK